MDIGSIPAGAHVQAGSRDVPGSERRIPDATTAFHAKQNVGYSGTEQPTAGEHKKRGAGRGEGGQWRPGQREGEGGGVGTDEARRGLGEWFYGSLPDFLTKPPVLKPGPGRIS